MKLTVGNTYKLRGQSVTLIKIFPFNPRQPDAYRCRYSNGAVVDCRASELGPVTQSGINASPYFNAPFEHFTLAGERIKQKG